MARLPLSRMRSTSCRSTSAPCTLLITDWYDPSLAVARDPITSALVDGEGTSSTGGDMFQGARERERAEWLNQPIRRNDSAERVKPFARSASNGQSPCFSTNRNAITMIQYRVRKQSEHASKHRQQIETVVIRKSVWASALSRRVVQRHGDLNRVLQLHILWVPRDQRRQRVTDAKD